MSFAHDKEHEDHDMMKIEVNLDDMTPEALGYVLDKLLNAGANDVFYTAIYMKKNRPGVLLQVLCDRKLLPEMKALIFSETTTFGIRYYPLSVHRLERRTYTVATDWGDVRVKEGKSAGQVVQCAPEYEDCRKHAEQAGVPLKRVYEQAWQRIGER